MKVWNGLEAKREGLRKRHERGQEREQVKGKVRELALALKRNPELEAVLKGPVPGIADRARFALRTGDP